MKLIHTTVLLACSLLTSVFAVAECTTNRNAAIDIIKPDSIYTDHGDGTVTDNNTGLMWQKCSLGLTGSSCETGSAQTYTWQASLAIANDNTDYGYTDWRLPNVKELASLIDKACYGSSINETLFPGTLSSIYWSASPYASVSSYAWYVYFNEGVDNVSLKNNTWYVRLVRRSQ